ncbi:hypothetical protein ACFOLJ_15755 [Rugamonas sp. CCM 8940]|uniref:hypothetical protein n=1 Tax=Rugamonas sp. CCM 8940 TaxID=2765359 RepID=UPI0018F7AF2D|nr:hypothetical protein [Rugamonas sp. CCM 8940]MBJ7311090.1 hypothetical protein [Rugamonas sp. CCM 8940]
MQELSVMEIDEVSGGTKNSDRFAAISGALWSVAEISAFVPGAQAFSAFCGTGAAIMAGASGLCYVLAA